MRRLLALTLVVLGCTAIAQAQRQPPPPPNPLSLIPAFACSFPKHAATEWTATGPVTAMGEETFTFQVTNLNLRRGSARIVGAGGGTADVTAMLSATGLNVIEQTGYGNFILTTIFVAGGEGRVYLAAHSRHLGDLKTVPSVSQHFGTCQPVQATR
jgi:hypothetical protein